MQRVIIICRLNAARSVLAAAVIKARFPQFEVVSCGIEAITGSAFPAISCETASRWGFNIIEGYSVNIKDIPRGFREDDIVICSDLFMKKLLPTNVLKPNLIFSFSDATSINSMVPTDPVALSNESFRREVAKAVFCSSIILSRFVDKNKSLNISVFFTSNRNQVEFQRVFEFCENNSCNLLISNFEILPDYVIPSLRTKYLKFDSRGRFGADFEDHNSDEGVTIFLAKYERHMDPRDVLSLEFQHSLVRISDAKHLVMMCEAESPVDRIAETQILMASYSNSILGSELDISVSRPGLPNSSNRGIIWA